MIGAPKAGTTALHAALAQHPDVFVTSPKEPKYWLCDGAPPPAWCGPGDKHSQQEWIWRADEYAALFAPAGGAQARGESTPFYLWSRGAHRRIAERLPDVRLVAVVRDPIDRAYSNWMHLWSDGLEPEPDFETAFARQDDRVGRAGRRSGATATWGCTASSSTTSTATSTPTGCWCSATATSSTTRAPRSTGSAGSSGSARVWSTRSRATTRAASSGPAGGPRCWARSCGPAQGSGQFAPPQVWRRVSRR